ncbi:unnamed protein product [Phyllotreta striolata]|uniref:Uncharacterized protein n=1 Tax=Phyllotreta striolata TaxID=444603 RepID=A0A9N9TK54_PHYSR|nr:unnamed protein product [Phyllotreta striolata]
MRLCAWLLLIIAVLRDSKGQDDSLRSAVEALGQRQRELDYEDNAEYGYTLERPEDLVFLKPSGYGRDRNYYERALGLNYLDDDVEVSKRISSAFRERVEEDNQRQQLEEMAENLINNMDNRGSYNVESEDYDDIVKELWDKYKRPNKVYATTVNKRWMLPRFGLDGAGLKKRNSYGAPSGEYYDDTYASNDDVYDDDDEEYQYLKKRYGQNKSNKARRYYSKAYSGAKRFPVTKRSSDNAEIHERKRSTTKKQTDPKVEKELSNIFGGGKSEETTITPVTKPPNATKPTIKIDNMMLKAPTNKKPSSVNKEVAAISANPPEKPLQIKKKSIDWSDYFGLDRRKKSSEPDDLDKEWLIERYHKSMNKKRSGDQQGSPFRGRDDPRKKSAGGAEKPLTDEQKINDMDSKLRVMEDKIVDDALKFTGSHEGETDPKEVQEIKDKVISRLAAAYSLEKMRTALGEYRLAVAKERERLKNRRPATPAGDEDYLFLEEKRASLPRKHVVDKDREENPESDNNIKCSDEDDDCHEQNYKTPNEIIENHYGTEVCPAIVRVCSDGAVVAREYGQIFRTACHVHEMCLLCSNNSWFSPTRQCHSLFAAKAFDLCKGDPECQKVAQRSLRYLINVTRSLRAEDPSAINDCERSCPETDVMLEPASR